MSPEQAAKEEVFNLLLQKEVLNSICLLVVDEAHSIVQSTSEFRPLYSRLAALRLKLQVPPMALTATPPAEVRAAIPSSLGLTSYETIEMNLNRPEIFLDVRSTCSLSKFEDSVVGELEQAKGVTIIFIQNKSKIMELYGQLTRLKKVVDSKLKISSPA